MEANKTGSFRFPPPTFRQHLYIFMACLTSVPCFQLTIILTPNRFCCYSDMWRFLCPSNKFNLLSNPYEYAAEAPNRFCYYSVMWRYLCPSNKFNLLSNSYEYAAETFHLPAQTSSVTQNVVATWLILGCWRFSNLQYACKSFQLIKLLNTICIAVVSRPSDW